MLDLLKKEDGVFSLSKIMASVAFILAMVITLVELFTSFNFEHFPSYLTFTGSIVALATGRSVMNERNSR